MITVPEMREVERRAVETGFDESLMMENAGANAARLVNSAIDLKWKSILVFCGTGNNAGDGLVFARHAIILGAKVSLYFVRGTERLKMLARKNLTVLEGMHVVIVEDPSIGNPYDMLVDAMLGTGIKGDVSEDFSRAIEAFNSMGGTKVSLDCPSGLDADSGRCLGRCVRPDMTVTFHDAKPGLSKDNSGRIIIAGIGIPQSIG